MFQRASKSILEQYILCIFTGQRSHHYSETSTSNSTDRIVSNCPLVSYFSKSVIYKFSHNLLQGCLPSPSSNRHLPCVYGSVETRIDQPADKNKDGVNVTVVVFQMHRVSELLLFIIIFLLFIILFPCTNKVYVD